MLQVHAVLHKLDDGEQQFRVSQPTEDVLEDAEVFVLHTSGDAVAEGREHDDRRGGIVLLDASCDVEHRVVLGRRHHDDEVDLSAGHRLHSLFLAVHLQESRGKAEAELGIFREYLLVHTAVILEHEGVVGISDEQYVVDAVEHQVDEGGVFQCHWGDLRFYDLLFAIYHLRVLSVYKGMEKKWNKEVFVPKNVENGFLVCVNAKNLVGFVAYVEKKV